MNKVYRFQKQKGNTTIKMKIDLRVKTILKTIIISVIAVAVIFSLVKLQS